MEREDDHLDLGIGEGWVDIGGSLDLDEIDKNLIERYREKRAVRGKGGIIVVLAFRSDIGTDMRNAIKEFYEDEIAPRVKGARFVKYSDYRGASDDVSVVLQHDRLDPRAPWKIKEDFEWAKVYYPALYPNATAVLVPLYADAVNFLSFRRKTGLGKAVGLAPIRIRTDDDGKTGSVDRNARDTAESVEAISEIVSRQARRSWLGGLRDFLRDEIGDELPEEGGEEIGGWFSDWKRRREKERQGAFVKRQSEEAIRTHYRAWESKYDGVVLRWFVSWANQQTRRAPRVPIATSFALFYRRENSKAKVPRGAVDQIMRDFGLSGRNISPQAGGGNVLLPEDAKWLQKMLETERASAIVTEAATEAYENATDNAEEVIEKVVEKGTEEASKTIDKLVAQVDAANLKVKKLLEENAELRRQLAERTQEVTACRGEMQRAEKQGGKKMAIPPPPPPPPQEPEITERDLQRDEQAAKEIAKQGKEKLAVLSENTEKGVRQSAQAAFSDIRGLNFSAFMQQGAKRRAKREAAEKPKEKSTENFLADALRKKFANTGPVREELFEAVKAVLEKLAIGSHVISPLGYIERQVAGPESVGCHMCGASKTVGSCACGKGRFCGEKCLDEFWANGHGDVCPCNADAERK